MEVILTREDMSRNGVTQLLDFDPNDDGARMRVDLSAFRSGIFQTVAQAHKVVFRHQGREVVIKDRDRY